MANTYVMRESSASRYFIYPRIKHGLLTRARARRKIIRGYRKFAETVLAKVRRPLFRAGVEILCTYRREIAREKRRDARLMIFALDRAGYGCLFTFRAHLYAPFRCKCAVKERDMRANRRWLRTKRARAANILLDRSFLSDFYSYI